TGFARDHARQRLDLVVRERNTRIAGRRHQAAGSGRLALFTLLVKAVGEQTATYGRTAAKSDQDAFQQPIHRRFLAIRRGTSHIPAAPTASTTPPMIAPHFSHSNVLPMS